MVKSLLANLFSIELSRGSINRLRQQVSEAVAEAVEQAHQYVQGQEFVHGDETGFSQGNGDGLNPKGSQGWLWVLATPSKNQDKTGQAWTNRPSIFTYF